MKRERNLGEINRELKKIHIPSKAWIVNSKNTVITEGEQVKFEEIWMNGRLNKIWKYWEKLRESRSQVGDPVLVGARGLISGCGYETRKNHEPLVGVCQETFQSFRGAGEWRLRLRGVGRNGGGEAGDIWWSRWCKIPHRVKTNVSPTDNFVKFKPT